ncbi:MAG: hypothetical protein ACU837_13950 [Gammaproteobacteria bacterium]
MQTLPVLQQTLGEAWPRLAPAIRAHYALRPGYAEEITVHGELQVDFPLWVAPLLKTIRLFGGLLDRKSGKVATTVRKWSEPGHCELFWLLLGRATIIEEALSESSFKLDFGIRHPWWGGEPSLTAAYSKYRKTPPPRSADAALIGAQDNSLTKKPISSSVKPPISAPKPMPLARHVLAGVVGNVRGAVGFCPVVLSMHDLISYEALSCHCVSSKIDKRNSFFIDSQGYFDAYVRMSVFNSCRMV